MSLRPGYVYILTNAAWPGWVKIGSAKNLEARLAVYQTSSPFRDFKLEYAAHFSDRWRAEARLKTFMVGHRKSGTEWFQIHPDDARAHLIKVEKEK